MSFDNMKETEPLCRVVWELMRTERMHKTVVDSRISALGLHRGQHHILMELRRVECTPGAKALSQKDLAEKLGISAAAVAMTIKKMEADGYIRRVQSPLDSRLNELYLTNLSRNILERSHSIFREVDRATYAGLTEEEMDVMMQCLQKMQDNLRAMPEIKEMDGICGMHDKEKFPGEKIPQEKFPRKKILREKFPKEEN